jgi:hypothetical protein
MQTVTIDELSVDDEEDFAGIALYDDLKQALARARYPFRLLPKTHEGRWDRALFLNLTYWAAKDGADVLADRHLAADVVAHVAWHHLAATHVGTSSVDAMFLGESIASAFDLYLVGRLLAARGDAAFLETQVPAMAAAAEGAGLSARKFEKLLGEIASDPEKAFEDLRTLLFTATRALYDAANAGDAMAAFAPFEQHRFGPLLHHYELSNWVLFARAHAATRDDERVREVHRSLTDAKVSLDWLVDNWVNDAVPAAPAPRGSGPRRSRA